MFPLIKQIATDILPIADLASDVVTVILGLIAFWGLIFKRKELSLAFRLFTNTYLNQRVNRLKETLGRLESLSYDNKEHRSEIHALIGQVCGQVRSLTDDHPKLDEVHKTLLTFMESRVRLTESKKRKIIYEIHGHIDSASFDQSVGVFEKNK